MTEYNKMVKGYSEVLETSGGIAPVYLPFQPDYVEFINYDAMDTPTATWIVKGFWDKNMGQGQLAYDFYDAGPVYSTNVATTLGVSTFAAGLSLQYGNVVQHGGSPVSDFSITAANPAVVTTVGDHGLTSGDVVVFSNLKQTATTGMQQIAGIAFTVTVTGSTTFSIPWDASGAAYTAFNTATSTNNVGSYKKVLYPYLYAPGVSIISGITNGTTTTIDTTTAHNFVVGQEVAIRIPNVLPSTVQQWGPTQLNSLPNSTTPGSPIYGYVVAVTDYNTVVVNIDSTGFTSFSSNIPFSSYPGLNFCQIVAVGDVNTGGVQISANSALYPPPYTMPIATTRVNTINGPAIQGAFFNNTRQGFVIGSAGAVAAQVGQTIYWRAFLHDMSVPV